MYRLRQLLLILGDLAALFLGLYLAIFLRYQKLPGHELATLLGPMIWLFALAIVISFIAGLYDLAHSRNSWKFFQKILLSALAWTIFGMLFFYVQPQRMVTPKTILVLTASCGFGLIAFWRFLHNKFISKIILKTNVVFIGVIPETLELAKEIKNNPQIGYRIAALIEGRPVEIPNDLKDITIASDFNDLKNKINGTIQIVVLAPHMEHENEVLKELYGLLSKQVEIVDLAKFYEEIMGRIPPFTFSESWFLTNFHEQQKKIYDRFKILMDYFFGSVLAVFFLITFPFIAILIKSTSRGSLFFAQERVGKTGKPFKMYKYRTMKKLNSDGSAEISGPQFAEKQDSRVTAVGQILRRVRLDEIPQFINILRGEMSLIGPRPERPEFVRQLTEALPFYSLRHLVKPGLAGWAQLQSGYYGTIEENLRKLEYDLFYIKNRGPFLDIIIFLRTINVLIRMMGR